MAQLNKQLRTHTLLSMSVWAKVKDYFSTRGVDIVGFEPTGRDSVDVFELLKEVEANDEWMYTLESHIKTKVSPYDQGWCKFKQGEYEAASRHFQLHLQDQPEDACARRIHAIAVAYAGGEAVYRRTTRVPWDCIEEGLDHVSQPTEVGTAWAAMEELVCDEEKLS